MATTAPRTVPGIILAVYTLVAAAVTLWGFSPVTGVADYTRSLLALLGIAGAILLLVGNPLWKPLLILWAVAQIPVIIVDPSGELTRQFLFVGVSSTESHSFNGQITDMSGFGLNFWGVVLLIAVVLIGRRRQPRGTQA